VSQRYIVEFAGQAYGILEGEGEILIFHATHPRVMHLDGQTYVNIGTGLKAVEQAARAEAA